MHVYMYICAVGSKVAVSIRVPNGWALVALCGLLGRQAMQKAIPSRKAFTVHCGWKVAGMHSLATVPNHVRFFDNQLPVPTLGRKFHAIPHDLFVQLTGTGPEGALDAIRIVGARRNGNHRDGRAKGNTLPAVTGFVGAASLEGLLVRLGAKSWSNVYRGCWRSRHIGSWKCFKTEP